jgi:radical SAM superfamily enzyme YgiQ (UPF0313 family)
MDITIILPQSAKHRYRPGPLGWSKTLGYEPPGLALLATLAKRTLPKCRVRVIDEMVEVCELETLEADLVGISVITPTAHRAYGMAAALRRRGVTVILGGRHVTLCPEEAAAQADAIVIGRAEASWPELLKDFAARRLKPRYQQDAPFGELASDRSLTSSAYLTKNTVQSSIGCPYRCSFCVVPKTQPSYQRANLKVLLDDIARLPGKRFIDVALSPMENLDDGFLKRYLRELTALHKRWGGLSTASALENPELFKLLVKSGLKGVLIGFESLSQRSLRSMGKGFVAPKRYLELVRKLHDHGVTINGCFIFGADEDDADVFDRTLEFVFQAGIDLPRFAVLTPFPGTPLFSQLAREGRLLSRDWSRYDTQQVVFTPKQMTVSTLQAGLSYAWRQAYSFGGITRRVARSAFAGTLAMLPVSILANLGYVGYGRYPAEVPQPCERPWSRA